MQASETRATRPTDGLSPEELSLYQHLAEWRRQQARAHEVPPFQVLTNRTLADLARRRPSNTLIIKEIFGIGPAKAQAWGEPVLAVLHEGAQALGLALCDNIAELAAPTELLPGPRRRTDAESVAEAHRIAEVACGAGLPLELTAELCARAPATVAGWLEDWAERHPQADLSPWLSPATRQQVREQAQIVGCERLKPVREAVGAGTVSYLEVRLALVGLRGQSHVEQRLVLQ